MLVNYPLPLGGGFPPMTNERILFMKYDYTVKHDGEIYESGQEVPDMGTLVCTSATGNVRAYEGLAKDVQRLPTYVSTGSSFLASDTGDYYKFEASTKTWNKM